MAEPTTPNSQYQGVSTPPDGGNVSQVSYPDDNDSTLSTSSAPNTPPTPQPAQNAPQGTTAPTQQAQPQTVQDTQTGKQPDLSKPQQQAQPQGNVAPVNPVSPAVKKASRTYDVAEVLAGGPRYNYDVDAYGNMTRQKVPVSGAHLALAIAMEALGGGLTGLANGQGPNGAAKAAAAGFQQGKQQVTEQEQQQKQQATEDYARRAQVLETNMKMYSNARALSKQDADSIDSYVNNYKELADKLQTQYPGYVEGPVKYSDFSKYHVTLQNAIPYMRVPRLGDDGKQVEQNGVPQWDIDYLVIDPKLKGTGWFNKDEQKAMDQMGQGMGDPAMLNSTPFGLGLALNKKATASQWVIARDNTFPSFFDTLDKANNTGTTGQATTAPKLPNNIDTIADQVANDTGLDANLLKGLIAKESGGDPKAISSTGAQGLTQLTTPIAQKYGATNRMNPEQNAKAGALYFKDLLKQYDNDPRLAYAAYYSGPGAIKDGKIVGTAQHTAADTTKQANTFSSLIGLQANTEESAAKPAHNDLVAWTKDHPTTPSDVQSFLGALNGTDGNYGKALEYMTTHQKGDAANNISAFLGGADAIKTHDDYVSSQAEQRKLDMQTNEAEKKVEFKNNADEANSAITQSYLVQPDGFKYDPSYSTLDANSLRQQLESQGVKVPTNFSALYDVGKYKAPQSTLPPRTWQKGAPNEMDAQTGLSYIQQFINPGYDATKFPLAQKALIEAHSGNAKNGAAIQNAATAAQHLELLRQQIPLLKNGNIQVMNKLANDIGVQVGASPAITFQAIADKVTQEVEKVAAGGNVPYKEELAAGKTKLSYINSPQQLENVIKAYTGLMAGRINPIDENYYSSRDEHLDNVDPKVTALFQNYGYDTPWDMKNPTKQVQIPQGFTNATKDGKYFQKPDGTWVPSTNVQP